MTRDRIAHVRAFVEPDEGKSDATHWVEGRLASPLGHYPEYRVRSSWGLRRFGSVVVEAETTSGLVGVGRVSVAGTPAAWVVENYLADFVEGADVAAVRLTWDRMRRAVMHLGGGVAIRALSAIDLALWDALGQARDEPVHALLGGAVHDRLPLYATGPRPDVARDLGFLGAKLPIPHGPSEGADGLAANLAAFADARSRVGPDFPLAVDCWMSFDVPTAIALADGLVESGLWFIEEALEPDDHDGYRRLRQHLTGRALVATGEHEPGVYGFRDLLERGGVDVLQPDLGWSGGLTEVVRVAALADAYRVPAIVHGPGPYGLHFSFATANSPYAEMLMPGRNGDETDLASYFPPEWCPVNGSLGVPQSPGFGVHVDTSRLHRPFPH